METRELGRTIKPDRTAHRTYTNELEWAIKMEPVLFFQNLLAEDRLIPKQEYAARRARLEGKRAGLEAELATLDGEISARAVTTIDVEATMRGLRRLGDVFDELEGVVDRRRPLCPYPQVAAYTGTGNIDEAQSFTCKAP